MRNYYAPQVRRLLDKGLRPKEVAALLKISRHAVYQITYRDRLRELGKPINKNRKKSLFQRLKEWFK